MQLSQRDILLILDALLMASKKADTPPQTMMEFLALRARIESEAQELPTVEEEPKVS